MGKAGLVPGSRELSFVPGVVRIQGGEQEKQVTAGKAKFELR